MESAQRPIFSDFPNSFRHFETGYNLKYSTKKPTIFFAPVYGTKYGIKKRPRIDTILNNQDKTLTIMHKYPLQNNPPRSRQNIQGFTLAELLISLGILGIIATFTIPKIILTQQNNQYNAIAKETAAMLSAALANYKITNTVTASTSVGDLTPYMNYVKVDSISQFDYEYGSPTGDCGSGTDVCLRLHNGAILNYAPSSRFDGTNTTNAVYFYLDPDGVSSSTTNGPGKSILFWLYSNGSIKDVGNALTNTSTYFAGSTHTYNATPSSVPPWFSW